ncbi:hypothetical protein GGG16DRAFT_45700 [Schizophyllum commune]
MVPPTNTNNSEPEPEPKIDWGPPTAWLPDPRTGRMREYTHAEILAALLAGDPEEERREREDAKWLEREESARKEREEVQRREREEAQRREHESAERRAREQEQRSSPKTSKKRGHTHAAMLAALLGDSEREGREPKQRRDQAQRGDHNPTESRPCEHEKQPSSPPGTKKRRERTHADMLAALLGDPSEERREREQAERREREEAQRWDSKKAEQKAREPAAAGEEEQSDEDDDDIGPISFAGGPLLEGMGLPTLDEAMQKLELRAKRQEEKEAAKKKSEEDAAKQKVEAEPAKQEAGAAKEDSAKKEGPPKKATTVNSSRNHEDMGEARRMPDCRCARCDPCDCDDCHYAHYPTYRRRGLGKW